MIPKQSKTFGLRQKTQNNDKENVGKQTIFPSTKVMKHLMTQMSCNSNISVMTAEQARSRYETQSIKPQFYLSKP